MMLPKKIQLLFVYCVFPFVVLLIHSYWYWPFLSDDALITLRYAERFMEGKGLTWNDDLPVEGYSNLAWLLSSAALARLGIDLVDAVRILGFVCVLGVLLINFILWDKNRYLFLSQLFLVLSAPIVIWAIGGLEQPLVLLSITFAVYFSWKSFDARKTIYLWFASFSLGVLCITRPDSPVLCAGLAIGLYWLYGWNIKKVFWRVVILAIFPVMFFTVQLIFRVYYYGEYLPNTAHIKLGFSVMYLLLGLVYFLQLLLLLSPLIWLLYSHVRRYQLCFFHPILILAIPIVLLWALYSIWIGGDIFPGLRHYVFVFGLIGLVMPFLLRTIDQASQGKSRKTFVLASIIFIILQFVMPSSLRAKLEVWEWQGKVLAEILVDAFGELQPTIAVTAAGVLPYYTKFTSIDMYGLNDHFIARNPSSQPEKHWIGHGFANGRYVLDRQPDIVSFFCTTWDDPKPCRMAADEELYKEQEFFDSYSQVKISAGTGITGVFWIRNESNKIGVRLMKEGLFVPAYLANGNENTVNQLNSKKQLSALIDSETELIYYLDTDNVSGVQVVSDDNDYLEYQLLPNEGRPYLSIKLRDDATIDKAFVDSFFLEFL